MGRYLLLSTLCLAIVTAAFAFEFCQEAPAIVGIGSSTVFPIADLHARKYIDEHVFSIARSSGSTLGIRNLLLGAADVGHASRAIEAKDYENADCSGSLITNDGSASADCQGVLPIGVVVANDVIAIIANPAAGLSATTSADLPTIFGEGSQYNSYIPDRLSGTYDFFVEAAGFDPSGVTGYFADDTELVSAVAADPNGIGFVGIGHIRNAEGITVVPVDNVDPSGDGDLSSYPFFRPLFMYYNDNAENKPMVQRYICALLADQDLVSDAGFLVLTGDDVSASQAAAGCADVGEADSEDFDGGDEQFVFCKDVRAILALGSSTVFPVTSRVAGVYPNPFAYSIARSAGSTVGIQTYLAGASDLAAASRALAPKDYEAFDCDPEGVQNGVAVAACQGKVPVGLVIGRDMLSIVVPDGSSTTDLSSAELADIVTAGDVTLCVPDIQSGTRDFFEEAVAVVPDGVQGFTNDDDTIECVRSGSNTLGVVPVAYLTGQGTNVEGIQIVTIDGLSPIDDADTYPLGRPLYLYFDATPFATNDLAQDYMCYVMSAEGQAIVSAAGYVTASDPEAALANVGLVCPQMFLQ